MDEALTNETPAIAAKETKEHRRSSRRPKEGGDRKHKPSRHSKTHSSGSSHNRSSLSTSNRSSSQRSLSSSNRSGGEDRDSSKEQQDRKSKRRAARRKDDPITGSPGAVASKRKHSSSRNKNAKEGLRRSDTSDDKKKHRSRGGEDRPKSPGAVASSNHYGDDVHLSPKGRNRHGNKSRGSKVVEWTGAELPAGEDRRSRKEGRNKNKKAPTGAEDGDDQMHMVHENGDELAVAAEMVEDDEERFRKYREQRERELQEEQEANLEAPNNDEESPAADKSKTKDEHTGRKRNTLFFCFCCCFILVTGGSSVGGLYAAGILSFSSGEEATEDPPPSVPVLNETETPTEAPQPDTPKKTDSPTSAPTFFVYDPISPDQCTAIANGDAVDGQENMIEKSFALILDSQLNFETEPPIVLEAIHQKIQEILAPKMAGCDIAVTRRRSLNVKKDHDELKYIVGNLVVSRVVETGEECSSDASANGTICIGMRVNIGVFVRGNDLSTYDYIVKLSSVLNGESADLAIELGLDDLFRKVLVVQLLTLDPTTAPTVAPTRLASEGPTLYPTLSPTSSTPSPTFMPVSFPTTERPTASPTVSPTVTKPSPTQAPTTPAPTIAPTPRPTLRPSLQPAPGVTAVPTSTPTKRPSAMPSKFPTSGPSEMPSIASSSAPSNAPSSPAPSNAPSPVPSSMPSNSPSLQPSKAPSTQPSGSPSPQPSLTVTLSRAERIDAALTTAGYPPASRHSTAYDWLTQLDTWEDATFTEEYHWVERYAMAVIYHETDGPNWTRQTNWLSTTAGVCSWQHVEGCHENGRVSILNLQTADRVIGTLPMEFRGLDELLELYFQNDEIVEDGRIPPAITQLSNLQKFWCKLCSITRIGAEVATMTSLNNLALIKNDLENTFPTGIFELTSLTRLDLNECAFNDRMPSGISALSNLRAIHILGCGLLRPLPADFFQLPNLEKVSFHKNYRFLGAVPTEFGSMTKLTNLKFNWASLTGTIPTELLNLASLTKLELHNNNLNGAIPPLPRTIIDCRLEGNRFSNTANRGACSV